ncbi:unnamed protein product [Pleuronectes platessa]|uniref:Uncharacterized protein n=1 Tax=Pleuronectes platessa TaxID=8262 RepID=A0A9N7YSR2_PLEPL|nr:unnamed protein product [Pleuronectes platessa]
MAATVTQLPPTPLPIHQPPPVKLTLSLRRQQARHFLRSSLLPLSPEFHFNSDTSDSKEKTQTGRKERDWKLSADSAPVEGVWTDWMCPPASSEPVCVCVCLCASS